MKELLPGSVGQGLLEASQRPGRKREWPAGRPLWRGAQACSPRGVLARSPRQPTHAAREARGTRLPPAPLRPLSPSCSGRLVALLFYFSGEPRTSRPGPRPVFLSPVPADWPCVILGTPKRHLRESVSDRLVKETPARCPYSPSNDRLLYFFPVPLRTLRSYFRIVRVSPGDRKR